MSEGSAPTRVELRREGPNQPWGFRLQGGIDFPTALSIQSVSKLPHLLNSALWMALRRCLNYSSSKLHYSKYTINTKYTKKYNQWRRQDFTSGEAQLATGWRGCEYKKNPGQTNDF